MGDEAAERALYDAHVDRVYWLANRMCGRQDLALRPPGRPRAPLDPSPRRHDRVTDPPEGPGKRVESRLCAVGPVGCRRVVHSYSRTGPKGFLPPAGALRSAAVGRRRSRGASAAPSPRGPAGTGDVPCWELHQGSTTQATATDSPSPRRNSVPVAVIRRVVSRPPSTAVGGVCSCARRRGQRSTFQQGFKGERNR
jgi:hypothetical protein